MACCDWFCYSYSIETISEFKTSKLMVSKENIQEKKVFVVLPAYNAEKTLLQTYNDIPKNLVDRIILVDDKSSDGTVALAKKIGIETYVHEKNLGYGGNQKTCYKKSLELGADIVVMLHPDYQYDPKFLPDLVEPLKLGRFDMMLGSRFRSRHDVLEGGMPLYKYLGNRGLTFFQKMIFDRTLSEFHTGYRAYTRKVLQQIPFDMNSDDYVFDSEFLAQAIYFDFSIGETFVPTKYFPEAHSPGVKKSIVYGLKTLLVALQYLLASWGLKYSPVFPRK